jgi:hypothetical protein
MTICTATREVLVVHRNAPLSETGRLRLARCGREDAGKGPPSAARPLSAPGGSGTLTIGPGCGRGAAVATEAVGLPWPGQFFRPGPAEVGEWAL